MTKHPYRLIIVTMSRAPTPIRKSTLDKIDRQIVAILREDGRLSASEVAGRIGNIAERTVRHRIAGLRENKHIVISAIPDPTSLGQTAQADLLISTKPGQAESVARQIAELEPVGYLCAQSGEYNLGASVNASNISELRTFIDTEIATIDGLERINTMVVMRLYKVFNTRTSSLSINAGESR